MQELLSALDTIRSDQKELTRKIDRIDRLLRGNGATGLVSRVAVLENAAVVSGRSSSRWLSILALIITNIIAFIALLVSLGGTS